MPNQLKLSINKPLTKRPHSYLYTVPPENTSAASTFLGSHSLLQMQRLYGNRYVQRAIAIQQESEAKISLVASRQDIKSQRTHMQEEKATGLNLQMSRLRDYVDVELKHNPSQLSTADIEATNEYRAYMNPALVWQSQLRLTREDALVACQLILGDMRRGMSISWQKDARTYALKALRYQGKSKEVTTERKAVIEAPTEKKVTTLCYRDFQALIPGWMAKHCFVWGHPDSVEARPENIQQKDTYTYDADTSGTMDPMPVKNTTCTSTFANVDPKAVQQKYQELCNPKDFNLTSFNCCTCAYLALSAAGAKVAESAFPPQNQGMSLPKSHGSGWKKKAAEFLWFNDIDELEQILDKNLTIEQLQKVPLQMKAKWIRDMMRGVYATKNEGEIVLKLFKGSSRSERFELYKLVEGHEWSGDWKEGVFSIDDDMVDALSRNQLNELRDIINAKQ